ncbi:Icarapin [Camponotus japonicus]
MKFHIALVAACLIACAHAFPSRSGLKDDSIEDLDLDFLPLSYGAAFNEYFNRVTQNFLNLFWNIPDVTNLKIPEGANTTSTVKVIDGHVVTINETTYTSGDENGGTAFRIRIIDVKPENDTLLISNGNAEPTTVKTEAEGSRETVEDMNNEISKNTDLTA